MIAAALLAGGLPWWWPDDDERQGGVPELTGATASPMPGSGPLEVSVEPVLHCPYSAGWLLTGWSGAPPKIAGVNSPDEVSARAGQRLTTGEPLDSWLAAHGAVGTFATWINVNLSVRRLSRSGPGGLGGPLENKSLPFRLTGFTGVPN